MKNALLALLLLATPAAAQDYFFKDGDVVVMIGDSITEQHLYSNYVEIWVLTRHPGWTLTFRNTGIGGDRSTGGNARFKRDVLTYKPTAMTVDFGMNDGGYGGFNEGTFKTYVGGLQGMAEQAKAAGVRAAWVTPQPLDNGDQGSTALTAYNVTLEKFCEGVKATAEKNGGLYVDQFHPYLAVLDKARGAGPKYDRITAGDAVHPGPPGQALMAASILKGLAFPRLVAWAQVGGAGRNCTVTEVVEKDGGIAFTRLDGALPFFPSEAAPILKWSPILEDLNEYGLTAPGLKPGRYEIRVGGTKIAEASAEDLAKGVPLAAAALAQGPIADQAKAVKAAVEAKNKFHHDRIFRGIVLAAVPDWLAGPDVEPKRKAAVEERLAKLPELDAAVRKALEMKPIRWELVPLK
jgi:lysophospholipase L1-like esterase